MTPAWRARAAFSLLLLSSVSLPAQQPSRLSPYERAQQLHGALEARPETQRTRAAYQRVLEAYRAVTYYDPASPRADASVLAIAQLLTEEGRLFSDEKLLQDAISRYESLHLEHPSGRYRYAGEIVEGERQARVELNELHGRAALRPPSSTHARHDAVPAAAIESQPSAAARAITPPAIQPKPSVTPSPPPVMTQPSPPAQISSVAPEVPSTVLTALHPGEIALVSGIRHWSTPVYTRIAIDLQDQVAYQAARVPSPDRIYFDLYNARLGPGLNGKSVEVIDDGFLRRIRAAQFSNNVTRIVLDVSSVSDYSAFLLPNPWRLIIDIHGLKPGTSQTTNLASAAPSGQQGARTPAPSAATNAPVASPPVANTPQPPAVASAAAGSRSGTQEIAALGQQPNRVQATDHPTTRPIAATVAGTVPAPQPDDGSLASPAAASPTAASPTAASPTPPPTSRSRKKPSPLHPAAPDTSETDDTPSHEAEPTSAGERSLVRTLGLKIGRIVIDAGHGGHDSGTTGPGGIEEKTVVLDVALRLGKLLKQRLGADVIFTRDNDTFIPLETRTAIANKAQADLFLSIHANSSPDSSARGVETYYLNFTTSPDALEVAARENAVSDESIHELSDLVKKITLKDKIDESREFAADVQKSLYADLEDGNPGLRDRGVKKAPFVVLIGANMPSILAEISFLTNSDDARELQQPAYRQRIAESLYRGVARYISGLSGVRLAQSTGRPSGN